jgi:hypothetical protein
MYTQIITPTKKSIELEVPRDMIGHTIKVTFDELTENGKEMDTPQFSSADEVHRYFDALRLDLRGYKFDREEANRRKW